jgi:hypothetical protein
MKGNLQINEIKSPGRVLWLMPVILAIWKTEIRRIAIQVQPRKIILKTPHLQINQSKIDWRCGSSGRVHGPELKPQSHQKNFLSKL